MASNGTDDSDCPHEDIDEQIQPVKRDGRIGFAFVDECTTCGATWYEPSNLDLFPDTGGLDPRLYSGWYEGIYKA